MGLFFRYSPPIEKRAAAPLMLPDDVSKWPQEITSEVYRQFPFLSGMDVQVELSRIDEKTGVGVGKVTISRVPPRPDMEAPPGNVIFPIIIRGRELAPLDLASDGVNYFPATQERLEAALANPALASPGPHSRDLGASDAELFTDLMPPRGGMMFGFPGLMGMPKMGSAEGSLLKAAAPYSSFQKRYEYQTALKRDASRFLLLKEACPYIEDLPVLEKTATPDLKRSIPPTTLQLQKIDDWTLRVTTANRMAFEKIAQDIPMGEAQEQLPPEAMEQVQQEGEATYSIEAPVPVPPLPRPDPSDAIDGQGEYLVYDQEGQKYVGWATNNVQSFDGQELGMTIFTNGAISALQPQIAGVKVGTGHYPPTNKKPSDAGCFIARAGGKIFVYEPVQIMSSFRTEDGGIGYVCQGLITQQQLTVMPIPEIRTVSPMGEGAYGITAEYEFLPLTQQIQLLMPGEIVKQASLYHKAGSVKLASYGGRFYFSGIQVNDLPEEEKQDLSKTAAKFLLVTMGVKPKFADSFLKQAEISPVYLNGLRPVFSFKTRHESFLKHAGSTHKQLQTWFEIFPQITPEEAVKTAAIVARAGFDENLRKLRPWVETIFGKTAAPILPGQGTVDSILSLGLITPENLNVFLRKRPLLEDALSTLSSLLLFARLGAKGLPELSLERAVSSLDQVLTALGSLPETIAQ